MDLWTRMNAKIGNVCAFLLAFTIFFPLPLFAQAGANQKAPVVRVPFVGCKSDGQTGPLDAPNGADKIVQIDASAADKLAYYKAEQSQGVLAPRGWYCAGVYGSNGATLYVTPQPIEASDILSASWSGITGSGIEISGMAGDTSGRFEVARVIARVFPSHKAFVESVIQEGIDPASTFPFGPYPQDRLTTPSGSVVEYVTAPNSEGLGTESDLKQSNQPIEGVAILQGEVPNLLLLSVRLPVDTNNLASQIVTQTERDSPAGQ